ncbi:response regulator [Paenibacillus antri]|uniref:Response regulator n=1 Tax=Paenibacillus antri TaxID=2582848 RepID=A0A5R9GC53_9BACL|nr:response regulator [Paenibacillus antri]TLS54047.1 response regulator [Paenibacillus antri]
MNTIFLVEDEVVELELLQEHIAWEDMGLTVVGAARNGKRAWAQIQELQPDIVLTDVRMPIMDGLRLAALVQESFDWMKVVFLSGHDEFAYVKSALESGAVGYLLKPIDPGELANVMARVKDEVKKARLLRRSKQALIERQVETLLTADDPERRRSAWAELTGVEPAYRDRLFEGGVLTCADAASDSIDRLAREALEPIGDDVVVATSGEGERFIAISVSASNGSAWERLTAAFAERALRATVGVCDRASLLSDAPGMLAEARLAAECRFHDGLGRIYRSGDASLPQDAEQAGNPEEAEDDGIDDLPSKMNPRELPDLLAAIEAAFDRMAERRAPRAFVSERAAAWLRGLSAELEKYEDWPERGLGGFEAWRRTIETRQTIGEVKSYVVSLLRDVCEYVADKAQDRHAQIVTEVAAYLDAHYAEPLTIESLAGKVYLSPNYLRSLFKEKRGVTIHDYLTSVRLQRSLELLRDRSLKIKDVAGCVGYDNTSYFCSLFYKTQGVTPNEYRKKFL